MSKVDALRALREARYAANAVAPKPAPGAAAPGRRPAAAAPTSVTPAVVDPVGTGEDACGHRNMGGRSCTRPLGHAETSHRYAPKG